MIVFLQTAASAVLTNYFFSPLACEDGQVQISTARIEEFAIIACLRC